METNSLHTRVRRRLFDEEKTRQEESTNDTSKILDLSDVIEDQPQNSTTTTTMTDHIDATPATTNDNVSTQEKPVLCLNQLLIVTNDQNSQTIRLLKEQTKKESDWFELKFCQPVDALQYSHQQVYKSIYTDIDLSPDSEMLRVICSIRKSSMNNTRTPIIAISQNHSRRGADNLFYYGISFVCYGKLSSKIFEDLQNRLEEYDPDQATVIDVTPDNEQVTILEEFTKIKELDLRLPESTVTGPTAPFSTLTTSAQLKINMVKSAAPLPLTSHNFVESNTTPVMNKPVYFPESILHMDQQKQPHIVRPIIQRPIIRPIQRPVHLLPKPKVYQPFFSSEPMNMRPCSYKNETEISVKQNLDIPYMISGEAAGNNLTITMLSDDVTKHSTKERMRRERIKYCCEQFRELLPKGQLNKKIDMATVMELTVFYIKMLQKNSSPYCQQQCSQVFEFYYNQLSGKRNCSESEEMSPMNPAKVIRIDTQRSSNPRSRSDTQSSLPYQVLQQTPLTTAAITTKTTSVSSLPITTITPTAAPRQKMQFSVETSGDSPVNVATSSTATTTQHHGVQTSTKLVQTQLHSPQMLTTYFPASHAQSSQVPFVPQGYRYLDQPFHHHYMRPHYHQPMEYYGIPNNPYEGGSSFQHMMHQSTGQHTHPQKEIVYQQNVLINNQSTAEQSFPTYKY